MDDIELIFVGDVMLGRMVNRILRTAPPDYPWGDTLPLFAQADFRVCNLESAISVRGEPWPDKAFHFRTDTKNVAVLGAAGINCVSLANNHTLDYGYDGLADTLRTLTAAGIAHAGAGVNATVAFAPALASVRGLRIAMLSFTDNEPQWEAREDRAGIAYVPVDLGDDRAMHLFDAVRAAKSHMNLVIVAAHWGPNWGYTPQRAHARFARHLIDCGADIIFGHSAHVFQGIEIYRKHPILYSAGNFVDDYAVDEEERNDESFVYRISIRKGAPHLLRLNPTVINNCQAQRAKGEQAPRIVEKMRKLCGDMKTEAVAGEDYLEISFD